MRFYAVEERNRWTQLAVGGRFPPQQFLTSICALDIPRQEFSAAEDGGAARRARKDVPVKAHLSR